MFAMIRTEELDSMGQLLVKQLKNRMGDETKHRRFVIGSDRYHMTLFDVDESEQEDLMQDGPVMEQTDFGVGMKRESEMQMKFRDFK